MTTDTVVIVLTTLPISADPGTFARTLVDERLAACVTVLGETRAVYRWRGEICDDTERQLVIKTTVGRVPALEARFATLHPYEVPEFLTLPVGGGGGAYLNWVRESVGA
jgi:periplasmic divalent cation tolerance protein